MGKQVSVIQFVGRTGELVGARSIKGDNITRIHRATIANPNTIPQQTQRTKFLAVSSFANSLPKQAIMGLRPYSKSARCSMRNAITKLYLRYPGNSSQFSDERLVNVQDSTVPGELMEASLAPMLLFFSKGSLPFPVTTPPQAENPLEIEFGDTVAPGINRASTNLVTILRKNDTGEIITDVTPLPAEGNLTKTINVPSSWNGYKVHIYSYYQSFEQPEQRTVHYTAIHNGAESTSKALESNAMYSDTHYVGNVTVM